MGGFREVGNTKRNNIQKNRENEEEEEERMQNAVAAVEGRAEEYRRRRE